MLKVENKNFELYFCLFWCVCLCDCFIYLFEFGWFVCCFIFEVDFHVSLFLKIKIKRCFLLINKAYSRYCTRKFSSLGVGGSLFSMSIARHAFWMLPVYLQRSISIPVFFAPRIQKSISSSDSHASVRQSKLCVISFDCSSHISCNEKRKRAVYVRHQCIFSSQSKQMRFAICKWKFSERYSSKGCRSCKEGK